MTGSSVFLVLKKLRYIIAVFIFFYFLEFIYVYFVISYLLLDINGGTVFLKYKHDKLSK